MANQNMKTTNENEIGQFIEIICFLKLNWPHFAKDAAFCTLQPACIISSQSNPPTLLKLNEVSLKVELFVYEGITSRPNTNVVDWNADQFLYPLHVATSSFWKIIIISYWGNVFLPSRQGLVFDLHQQRSQELFRKTWITLWHISLIYMFTKVHR